MNNIRVLLVAVVATGTAFVSGAADEKKNPANLAKPVPVDPTVHKTAVFNMAAVMRDFHQAKYQVYLLNQKKNEMSKDLLARRAEYEKIQNELKGNPQHPKKDEYSKRLLDLSRKIEDEDKKINTVLNDDASSIISGLHDKMKAVVDKTAEMNGFKLVLAYPDAVTPEEMDNPTIKELKLKPPAAQPFFVEPRIDITPVVIKTLNAWYPAIGPDGKPVDMSRLDPK